MAYPRKYRFNNVNDLFMKVESNSFTYASTKIYATVIYLRFLRKSVLIKTFLVTSKVEVISCASTLTIPQVGLNRLSLMGVESKNISYVLESVYSISNFCIWTDS